MFTRTNDIPCRYNRIINHTIQNLSKKPLDYYRSKPWKRYKLRHPSTNLFIPFVQLLHTYFTYVTHAFHFLHIFSLRRFLLGQVKKKIH